MEKAPVTFAVTGALESFRCECLLAAVTLQKIHRVHGYGVATHGVCLVVHLNLLFVFLAHFL